jgi:inorganic phosphate transporter, PiT family
LIFKGLSKVMPMSFLSAIGYGFALGIVVWLIMRRVIRLRSSNMQNTKQAINTLFTAPLTFASGIALGLALYGPKLIRTVGGEMTDLDQMRAICVAMAAALTVIVASQLGLPVSSTHIAIGGIFGVGFLRELNQRLNKSCLSNLKSELTP